jgi:hypothetical protein
MPDERLQVARCRLAMARITLVSGEGRLVPKDHDHPEIKVRADMPPEGRDRPTRLHADHAWNHAEGMGRPNQLGAISCALGIF